jgi:hypothetical protein
MTGAAARGIGLATATLGFRAAFLRGAVTFFAAAFLGAARPAVLRAFLAAGRRAAFLVRDFADVFLRAVFFFAAFRVTAFDFAPARRATLRFPAFFDARFLDSFLRLDFLRTAMTCFSPFGRLDASDACAA